MRCRCGCPTRLATNFDWCLDVTVKLAWIAIALKLWLT